MKRNTILIVDNIEANRVILRKLFEQEYNLLEAENGERAVILLNRYHTQIAAILLDIVMPLKDDCRVIDEISKNKLFHCIPVIAITSRDSSEAESHAFDLGATDIIMKPFDPHVVSRRVRNIVELNRHKLHMAELLEDQAVNFRESNEMLVDVLSSVLEHRSIKPEQHVLRIRMFTKILLEDIMHSYAEYDLDERKINIMASAAVLHDIGKIVIPDAILNKPETLTDEEFEIMKTHSEKGCEIITSLDRMHDKEYLRYGYNICRYHHERWDGLGYPDGLKGDNIPICAQVVGIVDAYEALTNDRVYKRAYSVEKACNMILNNECGCFSPKLLECFKNVRTQFTTLTDQYADKHVPKSDFTKPKISAPIQKRYDLNTLELGQMKYFSMLRYMDSTVMEVDIESGIYHLVYQQNSDFDSLRLGSCFEESLRIFAQTAVHSEDKHLVLDDSAAYIKAFLENGFMKQFRRYRVYHQLSGDYIWYEATALRTNIDDPRQQRMLIIWKEQKPSLAHYKMENSKNDIYLTNSLLIGISQCKNDQWYTIQYVNDGFVAIFGYNQEELKEKFQNRFSELIYPEDRLPVASQIHKQLQTGTVIELEYRMITKDGRIIWVLDKCQSIMGEDGLEYFNCVLIDITQSKLEQEKLRLTMERNQIIMDQTNDIIFEWDMDKDTFTFSSNFVMKFGYHPISEQARDRIEMASHILPEDIPKIVKLMKDVRSGQSYGEVELRCANAEGQYIWFRIRATTQFDSAGKPIKVVGVILDIDNEKRRAQDLIEKAERDTLTNLYNKNAGSRRIQHIVENQKPPKLSAMLIIDLDNFKQVNDSRGHMFGDAVLVEIATQLQKLFGSEDIVARIGGDEFLVFISNAHDKKAIIERAADIVRLFRGAFSEHLDDYPLSCSIGIACCPEDGTNYQDLFKRCDRALYYAKAQGKNRFELFNKTTMSKTFGLDLKQMSTNTRIDSDDMPGYDTNGIVQHAFKELYEAEDVEHAINAILEMVGLKFNVSRAYIFENSEDGTSCSNTFEWCNEGIHPQIDLLKHITYEELGGTYHENFDENGIFYCPDISVLPKEQYNMLAFQEIQAMLQCAVRDKGKFAGYVGFDDCEVRRLWTQNQIDSLIFISELLSTFLLKKRAQDRALKTAQDLRMILDQQNSYIYVIDPDTYVLQYINEKTLSIAPDVHIGMRCHEAFFNQNKPCETCPIHNRRNIKNNTVEVYNPLFHVWTAAEATFIHWGNKDAFLLSCHDITPYKTGEAMKSSECRANEL